MHTKKREKDSTGKALHRKNAKGFTLVEVIIAIGIIGLLSIIGYPSLSQWLPNYRLKAATREMYANFQKAKLHAVKLNKNVIFSFTVSAPCTGTSGYTFTDADGIVVASETMKNGVCLSSSTFTNGTSGFDPRGLPAGGLGTVKLKHTKISREYDITQSFAGRIRIQ